MVQWKEKEGDWRVKQTQSLEQLVQEQKLTLQKVAEQTGVSLLALEYMVQNNSVPKRHIAQKISKVLKLPVGEIWPELGQ